MFASGRAVSFSLLRRPRKKLLIAFVSFIGAVAAFLVIEHFRGPWMLNRWKKRMTAQGEVLDIDKLARPSLPPESNGLPQLTWVAGQLSLLPMQLQPPTARYAAPGKVVAITLVNHWPLSDAKGTNTTWVEVAEQLAVLDGPIQEVLHILAHERFSANLHYRSGFSLVIMHLTRLRSVAQALSAATLHDIHQGQMDTAFASLKGMLALVEVEKDEPIIISQLVRIALAHITFATTWQALQREGWTDGQLAQLQNAWADLKFPLAMEKALCMERAIAAIEYERCRTSDLPLSQMLDPGAVGGAPGPALLSSQWLVDVMDDVPGALRDGAFTPIWKFAWSHHDELHYCKIMQRMIDAHREVFARKAGATLPQRMSRIEDTAMGPYDALRFAVAPAIYPALMRAFHKAWIAQTAADLAVTALAIKRFELRHGRVPASLHELVPEFLPQCPLDGMDAKPLRYCVESDATFLLYSIGLDGKDDGGDGTHSNGGHFNFHYGRDLVWPQPASDVEILGWKNSRK